MKYILSLYLLLSCSLTSFSQDTDIPLNHELYHYSDRLLIKGLNQTPFFSATKPYSRAWLTQLFREANDSLFSMNEKKWHHRMQLLTDDELANTQKVKGIWNRFYTNQRDFFHVKTDNFELYVNPIINFGLGYERYNFEGEQGSQQLLNNSRGAVIRGSLFNKIGFYTEVYDNVLFAPQFVVNSYLQKGVLAGEGFVKRFGGRSNGFDFLNARTHLTFSPLPAMRVKLGKDRAFWGDGYQSLMLSDQSPDYLFLNIQTKIWKLSYVNHFTQMVDFIRDKNDNEGTFPRKYAVFHQLTYQANKNLSLSVFESIVYSPTLANGQRGFEIQYLNPIIFYRSAEQSIGSPDNGFLGFSGRFQFLKRFQLYGQVLIDDFNFRLSRENNGYWGNKLGYQAGLKYIDAFNIPTLDLQLEYNHLRPYTYQHFNVTANYTNYAQSLGHAAGANLYDWLAIIRFHPLPAWNFYLSYTLMNKGLDINGTNFGGDINRSYGVARAGDFEQYTGQGELLAMRNLYGRITYQLWKTDMYLEVEGRYRKENEGSSLSVLGGLRMNLPGRLIKY